MTITAKETKTCPTWCTEEVGHRQTDLGSYCVSEPVGATDDDWLVVQVVQFPDGTKAVTAAGSIYLNDERLQAAIDDLRHAQAAIDGEEGLL